MCANRKMKQPMLNSCINSILYVSARRAQTPRLSGCVRCGVAWRAVLCCAVLCCAVLCCAVLCCAVLCCAVLCCAVRTVKFMVSDLVGDDGADLGLLELLDQRVVQHDALREPEPDQESTRPTTETQRHRALRNAHTHMWNATFTHSSHSTHIPRHRGGAGWVRTRWSGRWSGTPACTSRRLECWPAGS